MLALLLMRANASESGSRLVDVISCIDEVFDGEGKPSLRTFREWQSRGFFPFVKIGRRTFFDPKEVRFAINKRCRVEAL
jgi:hypothetical protein